MATAYSPTFLFMVAHAWACIRDTHVTMKHVRFDQYFPNYEELEKVAGATDLAFCKDLLEVASSMTPPTVAYFKGLPYPDYDAKVLAVYMLVFEKENERPRLYVGSGTHTKYGAIHRLKVYDAGRNLPRYVAAALREGFSMVHKTFLCSMSAPTPAQVPVYRLLFIAFECSFSFLFWTMHSLHGHRDMTHLCPWGITTLEYDGMCSHNPLMEGPQGDFDDNPMQLTEEQLEERAIAYDRRFKDMHNRNNTNWHYKKMETDYDAYIGAAGERVARSRANNPSRDAKHQARRVEEAIENKTFYCARCDIPFGTKQRLTNHYKSQQHIGNVRSIPTKIRCHVCNIGFAGKSGLVFHNNMYHSEDATGAVAAAGPQVTQGSSASSE
jgi:hypothetical protein